MNSTLKHLVESIQVALPPSVAEINHVISRPYWETINVGEAFERIFSGFANDRGIGNDCEGKRGCVVDLYFHNPAFLLQVKTTHPLTKKPKASFQFCRTPAKFLDEAIQDVRTKFFKAFNQYGAQEFYLLHHDFKNNRSIVYHLASKTDRVKFHGRFLNGTHGSMSKDYLMVPKSDLTLVWDKVW
jgi:hypothetical protein